jgi:hypothetical protein
LDRGHRARQAVLNVPEHSTTPGRLDREEPPLFQLQVSQGK